MDQRLPVQGAQGDLLRLVATGDAESRADLARLSGLAASSVSLRVEELIEAGLLAEEGSGASRGGRRPRRLRLSPTAGVLAVADLGAHHARLALLDLSGTPLVVQERPWEIGSGPHATLDWLADAFDDLVTGHVPAGVPLRGVGTGIPGPVDPATSRVVTPSRMPGWNDFPVAEHLAARYDLPILVENDANLMAVGEARSWPGARNLMVLKAGTGIGCGVIVNGRLHRGRGAAGDISHVRVRRDDTDAAVVCACGHTDCLEVHASGAALAAALAEAGIEVTRTADIVTLVSDAVPEATSLVRTAGRRIGEVLTALVNFFNPDVVTVGGSLSAAEPLITSIRATVYERCLPLATRDLEIAPARAGRDAALLGAGILLLDAALAG